MTARTGDIIEQAMRVMDDYGNGYDGLNQFGEREALAQALSDAGLLRQEPPTRDEIARAIRQATDDGANRTEDYADAVLALWEGRKQ